MCRFLQLRGDQWLCLVAVCRLLAVLASLEDHGLEVRGPQCLCTGFSCSEAVESFRVRVRTHVPCTGKFLSTVPPGESPSFLVLTLVRLWTLCFILIGPLDLFFFTFFIKVNVRCSDPKCIA